MKNTFLAMLFLGLLACTDEFSTREALRKAGFTEIQTTGYDWLACSKDDTFHTGFRAKNPQGTLVDGVVCCGFILKACTIRF